jgi:hypothetical protein
MAGAEESGRKKCVTKIQKLALFDDDDDVC